MKIFIKFVPVVIILLISLWAIKPLFNPGFFPMHDDEQIGRLYQLDKDVMYGHLPPRLAQDLGFGFDYPLFNFYPPFVYYIGEIFHLMGFSYIVSTKIVIGLGYWLAAIFMYLFVKEYAGKTGGIVAAGVYTYAPYHSVDVYVRGAIPEFWSFVFVPALFWSFLKLAKTGKSRYVLISALFVACQILTHNLVALMSGLFLGLFFLFLIFTAKKKLLQFAKFLLSVILGLAFSAYFWIPSYFEKKYTLVDLLTRELADYKLHFVYLRQFIDSPWGYGGSLYGLYDGLSFEIGKIQLVLFLLTFVSFIFLLRKGMVKHFVYILFVFLFLFSLFIQTEHSKFVWDLVQPFAYIQFPWRFLLFTAFTLSFLVGYSFIIIKSERVQKALAVIAILALIFFNKDYFQPERYLPSVTDSSYTASEVIRWRTSAMAFEYVPRGIATKKSPIGNTIIAIDKSQIPTSSFSVISGKMMVRSVRDIPQQKEFEISASEPGLLQLNTFSFPGWKTFLNGRQIKYTDDNKFKLISVSIPKGDHHLRATFANTPVRSVAEGITVLSIVSVTAYGIIRKKYGKN